MKNTYKVNYIFNENGICLDELIINYCISFLDREFYE